MGSHVQSFCLSTIMLLILFSATLALSQPSSSNSFEQNNSNISQIFENWMIQHNRAYSNSVEKARRFEIFKAKYLHIQKFNNEGGKKKLYTLGLNRFSDMTRKEFQSKKCRRINDNDWSETSTKQKLATAGIQILYSSSLLVGETDSITGGPITSCASGDNYDWSESGHLSPVRDQGPDCASVAAVETLHRFYWNFDTKLSIQQVLDCADGGSCEGGSEIEAYLFMLRNRGLASERQYPYMEKNGTCDSDREVAGGHVDGIVVVRPNTEDELKKAICRGPVTAGISSSSYEFEDYGGGIFNGSCGQQIDHTVLVVGFGVDGNGVHYWKIQNSWGDKWGKEGFMRMSLEAGKKCQIAQEASFPLAKSES